MNAPIPEFHRARRPAPGAFTLLELLIAVSVFAVVLAAINGVFYGALRLRNKTAESLEQALPIQQALAVMKRDLAGIVPPGPGLAGTLSSGASSSALGGIASMNAEGGPRFFTNTGLIREDEPWSEVQMVTYFLSQPAHRGTSPGRDLIRGVTRNLLPAAQEQREDQWLLGGVERIAFFFYDGADWRESWDSTNESSALPKAVKVQIELSTGESSAREAKPLIELLVPIAVEARTNQTQTAGGQG